MVSEIGKLSELQEAEYNPRTISGQALQGLKYSLEEFGDLSGITFNVRTNRLVSGHQRVRALMEQYGDLQISEGKISTPNGETFNVRYVDWEEIKEKAANIAANSPTIQGEFTGGLAILLDELAIEVPETVSALSLLDIELPEIAMQDIHIPTETGQGKRETRNVMKFGTKTVYLTDDEMARWLTVYDDYCEKFKNSHGFISYILEGK